MCTGAAVVLVSMAGKQRIVLTVDKTIFQGYKVPSNYAEFVNVTPITSTSQPSNAMRGGMLSARAGRRKC